MSKKISIVIPMIHAYPEIYGTLNDLQVEMLDSKYDWEVIIAENSTVDVNTARMKKLYAVNFRKGMFKYVFEPRQCGPLARNAGAKIATGDFVMFLDQHTTFGKGTVDILADYLWDHKHIGLVSGLTSWSHYDPPRMGSFYELFHPKEKQDKLEGGPTLPTHMHGHYMPLGRLPNWKKMQPFITVMGSQAYTMYRLDEFLEIGAYFEGCRFYPHPEGYMPLKYWMTGRPAAIHPESWHIHGMFPRTYKMSNKQKIIEGVAGIVRTELEDSEKIQMIREQLAYDEPDHGDAKIKEYGGWSWSEHGVMNVMKIAYILGGEKWLDICYSTMLKKHGRRRIPKLKEIAVEVVEESGERDRLLGMAECTLDEVLTNARRDGLPGMNHWYDPIGPDPKGVI